MRRITLVALLLLLTVTGSTQSQTPALPLGAGRPEVRGITRTTLKDDAKVTVTRVHFEPGAAEPSHTHPYDIVLVPVMSGSVNLTIADRNVTALASGDVQFVASNVPHQLKNTSNRPFELIAIASK